jgi:hypothetical protein
LSRGLPKVCQIAARELFEDRPDCVEDLLLGEWFVKESELERLRELRPVRQIGDRGRSEEVSQDGRLELGQAVDRKKIPSDANGMQGISKFGRRRFQLHEMTCPVPDPPQTILHSSSEPTSSRSRGSAPS